MKKIFLVIIVFICFLGVSSTKAYLITVMGKASVDNTEPGQLKVICNPRINTWCLGVRVQILNDPGVWVDINLGDEVASFKIWPVPDEAYQLPPPLIDEEGNNVYNFTLF
ncbi:MAG: hypothetical protein GX437_05620 [Sphingobacteriales bacterium]|nr:hypothetical protein [Sphingobacteriales bacterium]